MPPEPKGLAGIGGSHAKGGGTEPCHVTLEHLEKPLLWYGCPLRQLCRILTFVLVFRRIKDARLKGMWHEV